MEKLELISASPLFEMLADQELASISELTQPARFAAGATIFEEGDLDDRLFVIVRGELEVWRRDDDGSSQRLTGLSAPEFFGEMALIDNAQRSATVRAVSDCDLLRLSADDLTTFRSRYPDGYTLIVLNIARVLSSRLRVANRMLGHWP